MINKDDRERRVCGHFWFWELNPGAISMIGK